MVIDIEISAHGRGYAAFVKMMKEDYFFEAMPAGDDELYSTEHSELVDDLFILDDSLCFTHDRKRKSLKLISLKRYFQRANKKHKEKTVLKEKLN